MTGLVIAVAVNWPVHDEKRLNAMAYSNLGSTLGARGDLPGAIHYLRRASEGHPQSAEIHFNLGYALSLTGDDQAAVQHYRQALALEPNLIAADFLLAVSLERIGDRAGARNHYQRAVERDPSNEDARQGVTRTFATRESD
jgi:Flp pilus assembly protein TadD